MSEVRKYQVKASDRPNKHEVRTGQALNAVATAGGLHAAYLTGKEITRAVRNGPGEGRHAKPVKVTRMRRAAGKVPGAGRVLRDPRKAALAGLGAWGVLHTGELVGDAISARALHRQSKIAKEAAVIEQSIVKSYTGAGESGTGRNLELVSKKRPKCPNCELPCDKDGKCPMCGKDCRHEKGESKSEEKRESKREQRWERKRKVEKATRRNETRDRVLYGTGIGSGAGAVGGYVVQRKTGRAINGIMRLSEDEIDGRLRGPNRLIAEQEIQERKAARAKASDERAKFERMMRRERMRGRLRVAHASESIKSKGVRESAVGARRALLRRGGRGALIGAAIGGLYGAAVGAESVRKAETTFGKALRRFDSEADRQRRMGLYAGGSAGLAAVAGNEARREFTLVRGDQVRRPNGTLTSKRPVKGVRLRPENKSMKIKAGSGRKAAVLAAIAAAGMATGVGSYKRGISRRNQPWT